ncbi:helix-hairpin-helix domain-containing protein [Aliifodinibius salicampi]|uniref:Helix-hairpin-helix domain-containing protein n=1 Tax=Fodinibius salicampi TaxID=1920655 RepID=A0ABT3PXN3_9BACT|nr:helix-hairpin-helix domain-containing protein [Fodinibius salicampi]MCW9712619.1 helix-hairpin-helix domain-containing protein [Fodinibius salicampi]
MKVFVIISLFLVIPYVSSAQERDSLSTEVQQDLEQALEGFDPEDAEANSEQLIQFLQELSANPVNVNTAGLHSLRQVPGLNLKTARAIIRYREERKPFETPDELVEVSGIGRVTYDKIRPYITIGKGLQLGKILYTDPRYWTSNGQFQSFSRYQRDLQPARGYLDSPEGGGYLGNAVKYYQRMGYRSNHLSINLTQEKDAGEILESPVRFDHQSWHLALEGNGKLRTLALGDYSLSFGQGLVLWNGGVFGKGGDVTGAANRSGRGIKPYTSAQESNYFRGAAATVGGRLQLTGFYSVRRLTASEISSDTIRFPTSSGYHRTARQYERRGNVRQMLYGGRLQMEFPIGIIGTTGYRTFFNRYITASQQPYARYDFRGTSISVFGIDYTLLVGPAIIFGEAARSENGGMGLVAGLESPVGEQTDMALAYRNYKKEFQSIQGSGFGESSGAPKNEEGVYLGLQHAIGENITLSGYMDQFRFPGPRFGTHQSTKGFEWLGRAEVKLTADWEVYLQWRSETKEGEYETPDELGRTQRALGNGQRSSIRANIEYQVNKNIRLRTRGELVQNREPGASLESGILLYQDVRLQLRNNLRLDTRLTVFDTESFATRVYQFENDLLYVFGSQVLFDQGQRMYLLLNYEPFSYLELWAKFGITKYEDKQVIGSGLNEIQGDTRSEIGIQARIKF